MISSLYKWRRVSADTAIKSARMRAETLRSDIDSVRRHGFRADESVLQRWNLDYLRETADLLERLAELATERRPERL